MNKNAEKLLSYGLIGVAGFVAPRHLKAIYETRGELIAAFDPNDSVGVLDSFFPQASFFKEFERFDRFVDKFRRENGKGLDFITICSPNYLHDSHARFSLRSGSDVICEKPLVLNPWNIDGLAEMEKISGKKVYTILQLRLHPTIIELKKRVSDKRKKTKYEIDLTYITSRGSWYSQSWKGSEEKSGGIASNIGVHFFDMLIFLFGSPQISDVYLYENNKASGFIEFADARVRWFLSLDFNDLPQDIKDNKQRTYRSIRIDRESVEFSDGFTDLHRVSYEDIIQGGGFGLEDCRMAIETVARIRSAKVKKTGEKHMFIKGIKN